MSEKTGIEWCDSTFNPWLGCTKVSPGCDNCYAEQRMDKRLHVVQWGAGQDRKRTKTWGDPVKWNAQHEAFFAEHGRRQRVFCASLADVFDNAVDPAWRADLFALIEATPHLDWLVLTKRIGNVRGMLALIPGWHPKPNVWLGITVVNQEEADRDIPKLLSIPAAKRFLSMEPLLGPVNLCDINEGREINEVDCLKPHTWDAEIDAWRDTEDGWKESFEDHYGQHPDGLTGPMHAGIDWVIVGGESGPSARPMHPNWARGLRDQCQAAGVSYFFKQWGGWAPSQAILDGVVHIKGNARALMTDGRVPASNVEAICFVGKKGAGRLLDGRTWDEVPS